MKSEIQGNWFRLAFSVLALSILLCAPTLAQIVPPQISLGQQDQASDPEQTQEYLNDLLNVLKDDEARQALTELLEKQVNTDGGASGSPSTETAETDATTEATDPSFGEAALRSFQVMMGSVGDYLTELGGQLAYVPERLISFQLAGFAVIWQTFLDCLPAAIASFGVMALFRVGLDRMRELLTRKADDWNFWLKLLFAFGLFVASIIAILIAYLIGAAVVTVAYTEESTAMVRSFTFLDAFLLIEAFIALERVILMRGAPWARLLSLSDWSAKTISRHFRIIAYWLGLGIIVFVPAVGEAVSFATSRTLVIYLYVIAIFYSAYVVIESVRYIERQPAGDEIFERSALGKLVRATWHWVTFAYLFVALIVVLTRPPFIVQRFVDASFNVAINLTIGAIIISFLSRTFGDGVQMPESLTKRLPTLQARVDALAPKITAFIQALVVLFLALFTLDQFDLIDLNLLLSPPSGSGVFQKALNIGIVLLIAAIIMVLIEAWIDFRLNPAGRKRPTSRERTLLALFKNAATIALLAFSAVMILSELGVNMAPLLASAGIVGIAVGFGAQKLVQDVITGLFIQVEGAIDVGDVVNVGGIGGVVERLTIRSVALRDLQGVYHIVPFSSVDTVSNYMRGYAFVVSDLGIAYREDVGEAKTAIFDAFAALKEDEEIGPNIIGDLEWMGVDKFGASEVVLRSRIKTKPGKQWETSRAFNAVIKRTFDERSIEIPFPHRTLYFGEDKKGQTQPLHVMADTPSPEQEKPTEAKKPAPRKRRTRTTKPSSTPDPDT